MRNKATYSTGPVYKATSDPLQEENALLKERVAALEEGLQETAGFTQYVSEVCEPVLPGKSRHPLLVEARKVGKRMAALLDGAIGDG